MDLSDMLNPSPEVVSTPSHDLVAAEPAKPQQTETSAEAMLAENNFEQMDPSMADVLEETTDALSHQDRSTDLVEDTNEASLEMAQMDGTRSPRPQIKVEPTIKTEPAATPRETTPASAVEPSSLDAATMKAIKDAQNEYSTRRVARKPIVDKLLTPEPEAPKPAPTKKRPAPKTDSPSLEGAPAGVKKPPPKKRKVEKSEDRNTPTAIKRSSTPNSVNGAGRTSKANAKNARKSSTAGTTTSSSPAQASSPAAASEAVSDGDDGEVYCICRRPDNHTFMIACDGGCDDWFHGKCVNVQKEDQDLLDKYICPICTEKGTVGVTTWKPMCRRDGCRKPARLKKGGESKYCSTECGVAFMKSKIPRTTAAARHTTGDDNEPEEPDLGPLGGAIRSHELKALALAAPTSDHFRRLGSTPPLTPPLSSSPEAFKSKPAESDNPLNLPTPTDPATARLAEIATRKAELRARHATLKDRERVIFMAKERVANLTASMKIKEPKLKDICGYDGRLSWDDATFAAWRLSEEGIAVFKTGILDVPEDILSPTLHKTELPTSDSAAPAIKPRPQPIRTNTSETAGTTAAAQESGVLGGVCTRKRCQRHGGWQKLALHDVRFEEAEVGAEMRRVEEEERELRRGGPVMKTGAEEVGGWVEVVGGNVGGEVGGKVDGAEVEAKMEIDGETKGREVDAPAAGEGKMDVPETPVEDAAGGAMVVDAVEA